MRKMRAQIVSAIILVGLMLCLAGCFEWLNSSSQQDSIFIVSAPFHLSSGLWEVTISVSDMPEGGLAGILVKNMGIMTSDVDRTSIVASGMNGFIVTAQDFLDPSPQGTLIAIHPSTGVVGGKILKFVFRASGSNPRLTVNEAKVVLLSDQGSVLSEPSGM